MMVLWQAESVKLAMRVSSLDKDGFATTRPARVDNSAGKGRKIEFAQAFMNVVIQVYPNSHSLQVR